MSDKRQKNQLVLAFTERDKGEAPKASQEGTESFTAKGETERPASHEQLMEEVCERGNCLADLQASQSEQRKSGKGIDGMKVEEFSGYLKQHWPSTGTTAARNLPAATGTTGRNTEGGRRGAKAWHPNGAGSLYPAGGDAGSATQMGLTFSEHSHGFSGDR